MKLLLLFPIRLYWLIIPPDKRRRCLFAESCSCFVYRITSIQGLKAGFLALKSRYHQCRPGYRIIKNEVSATFEMHLVDGSSVPEKEIARRLLLPINTIDQYYET